MGVGAQLTSADRLGLERAIELAEQGRGSVSPNPVVGAVVVPPEGYSGPEGMLGEGFHARYGGLHAEREALADCAAWGNDPRGATMCVSLEPCAHTGRQPPCVEAILEARIAKVVIAADDPSEKTAGKGPAILREAGVEVLFAAAGDPGEQDADRAGSNPGPTGNDPDLAAELALARRARLQNQPFRKHALTGKPFVTLKMAASLDGRIATLSGDSKWISGPESRELVHRWRAEADAVGVGIGTALADDPMLNARPEAGCPSHRQPLRVIFDSGARLPVGSKLVTTQSEFPLLEIFSAGAPSERVDALTGAGVSMFATGLTHDRGSEAAQRSLRVDLPEALEELGARGVTSLLCEGGPHLAGALLAAGEVDELRLFTAPLILGAGPSVIEGPGFERVVEALRVSSLSGEKVGDDLLIRAPLRQW